MRELVDRAVQQPPVKGEVLALSGVRDEGTAAAALTLLLTGVPRPHPSRDVSHHRQDERRRAAGAEVRHRRQPRRDVLAGVVLVLLVRVKVQVE